MKTQTYILLLLMVLLTVACSHIDDSERLIYVKQEQAKRVVLIEDFTGQRCVNCPNANNVIASLQESFGEDTVIAVAIHAGPLAFYTNTKFLGLRTQTGDEYFDFWGLEYQPVGLINRSVPIEHTAWSAKVREELQKASPITISLEGQMSEDKNTAIVETSVTGIEGVTIGNLQLWLTEDDVTAFQFMPDGTKNDDYHHRHVFRTAINGTWGEKINVGEGQIVSVTHSVPLEKEWDTNKLSIVAFVYTNEGVIQAKQFNY